MCRLDNYKVLWYVSEVLIGFPNKKMGLQTYLDLTLQDLHEHSTGHYQGYTGNRLGRRPRPYEERVQGGGG